MSKFISDRAPFGQFNDEEDAVAWLLLLDATYAEFSLLDCYLAYGNATHRDTGASQFLLKVIPGLVEEGWMTFLTNYYDGELVDQETALKRLDDVREILTEFPHRLPDKCKYKYWFVNLDEANELARQHPGVTLPDI